MNENINDFLITMPGNAENLQLPAPELLTYYKNLESRILWLDDAVSVYTMEFVRLILQFNAEDKGKPVEQRKPIKIMFASPGGNLDTCTCLIDTIMQSETPVWGINMSCAQSAACFIFLACHKRFSMPRATFLMHNGSAENISGTYEQILSFVAEYQRQIEDMSEYVQSVTKIPFETVEERLATEWYITAEEAVELGMVDKIINSLNEIV